MSSGGFTATVEAPHMTEPETLAVRVDKAAVTVWHKKNGRSRAFVFRIPADDGDAEFIGSASDFGYLSTLRARANRKE